MSELEKENMEREKKRNTVLAAVIGFGAGAVVGAITALLYAPQSGQETRELIKEKIGDAHDKASDALERTKESLTDMKEKMATAYESAVEKTSSAIEKAKERFSTGKKEE